MLIQCKCMKKKDKNITTKHSFLVKYFQKVVVLDMHLKANKNKWINKN